MNNNDPQFFFLFHTMQDTFLLITMPFPPFSKIKSLQCGIHPRSAGTDGKLQIALRTEPRRNHRPKQRKEPGELNDSHTHTHTPAV